MRTTGLRMGQSLAAVFYLPHFVARELGAFRDEGLCVEFVTSFGQQWSMLECGAVDIALGGPTRNMALYLRAGTRIVNFCAGLRANTWFLVARRPMANFHWADLVERTVIGLPDAPQGVCLRWILLQHSIAPDSVRVIGGKDTGHELEAFRGGEGDFLLHSLDSVAPLVDAGEAVLVQELATPTGPVPWSTYAALGQALETRRDDIQAFTRAIQRALRWIAVQPASAIATLLAPCFRGWTPIRLANAIAIYQRLGTWPRDALIPRAEWDRYCAMFVEAGALTRSVPYEGLVDASFGRAAGMQADEALFTPPPSQPLL
jgi:NitT/TauT family transport system substrate-binding protein